MEDFEEEVDEEILIESEDEEQPETDTPHHLSNGESSAKALLLVATTAKTVEETETTLGNMSPPLPLPQSLSPAPEPANKEANSLGSLMRGKPGHNMDVNEAHLSQAQEVGISPSGTPSSSSISRNRPVDPEQRRRKLYEKVADLQAASNTMATVHGLGREKKMSIVTHNTDGRRQSAESKRPRQLDDTANESLSFANSMTQKLQNMSEMGSAAYLRAQKSQANNHGKNSVQPNPRSSKNVAPTSPTGSEVHGQQTDLPDLRSFTLQDTIRLTKIQASARGLLARKHGKERFQLKVNGNTTRHPRIDPSDKLTTELEDLPDTSRFSIDDKAKATKMQAAARGFLARRQTKPLLEQKKSMPAQQESKRPLASNTQDELPDLTQFTAKDTAAVTKIQAGARGLLSRKRHSIRRPCQIAVADEKRRSSDKTVGSPKDLPDLSSFTAEEAAKITKIQAGTRGLLSRKRFSVKPASHQPPAPIRARLSEEAKSSIDLSTFNEEDTASIIKIQAGTRGLLSRKKYSVKPTTNQGILEERRRSSGSARKRSNEILSVSADRRTLPSYTDEEMAKVTKIQASARGMLVRKQSQRSQVTVNSSDDARYPSETTYTDETITKLIGLQAAARGHLSRKHARVQQVARTPDIDNALIYCDAVTVKLVRLQASARGHLVRKRLAEERQAITKMQAMARGHISRKQTAAMRAGGIHSIVNAQASEAFSLTAMPDNLKLEETLAPVKPPGRPRYGRKSMFQPKSLPKPEDVLSEEALIKRAEKKLGQMMHSTCMNMPTFYPQPPSTPRRFKLGKLSTRAREAMLRTARVEAETWLRETALQAESQKKYIEVEDKLREWHQQREAAKQAEEARKRTLEEEKEKVATEDRRKWKKRGERLRDQVAQWGAEKAMREEREERENVVAMEAAKKLEAEKLSRHRKRLRARLARWHQGLPVDDEFRRSTEQVQNEIGDVEDKNDKLFCCADDRRSTNEKTTEAALRLVYGVAARSEDESRQVEHEACNMQAVC